MPLYRLKPEYQTGRNSDLWELETLKSEWERHTEDFPSLCDYLDLYDEIMTEDDMSHYDEFHEKKASEDRQRAVFDTETTAIRDSSEHKKEWEEYVIRDRINEINYYADKLTVNHPEHYCSHPSGVECIQITEHMNFCIGNALKYIWRAGLKTEDPTQDLKKAIWYLQRELARIEK